MSTQAGVLDRTGWFSRRTDLNLTGGFFEVPQEGDKGADKHVTAAPDEGMKADQFEG